MIEALDGMVPDMQFKELRAWWCISYAAFLGFSETAQIRWQDVVVERSNEGSLTSVTVSLTVRERLVFKTTTESIKLKLLRANDARKAICPVLTLPSWLRVADRELPNKDTKVFCMDLHAVQKRLQTIAAGMLGGTQGQFGVYSLRAGAATDAEDEGTCLSEIIFKPAGS